MAKNKITYDIGFNVDTSQIQNLKRDLSSLEAMGLTDLQLIKPQSIDKAKADLADIQRAAKIAGEALEQSFNPKLNTVGVEAFISSLNKSNMPLSQLSANLAKAGSAGERAFRNIAMQALNTGTVIKQTNKLLDDMGETFANTIRWSITSSALNAFTSSIQSAWSFAKKLDSSLNDIRIVTGKSADEMERFAQQANKAAKGLGASTTAYTNASLIYYQQGLGEEDVQARTNVTIKAANVTGQSAAEVSEQLTAVWNGYKVVAEEAEMYVDKLAAVAATTAADLEELSTGMSKVASAANTMGVDIDQLSAQLSTIVSVTRQDANLVGTALKTIYARMGDLKVSGVDEFGTSLGDVSGQMRQMGIEVLDQEGNLRDMGAVIEEVAKKWGTWTDAQQQAAAVAIAGKRQYNNLIALFENWDMYEKALTTSQTSAGTLQKQQDIYMDSLEAKLQQLATSGEQFKKSLFDAESTKELIDGLSEIVTKFANLVELFGGGGTLLTLLGSTALKVFSSQIGGGITYVLNQIGLIKSSAHELKAELELFDQFGAEVDKHGAAYKKLLDMKKQELEYQKLLTEEEKQQAKIILDRTNDLENKKEDEKTTIDSVLTTLGNKEDIKRPSDVAKMETDLKSTETELTTIDTSLSSTNSILDQLNTIKAERDKISASVAELMWEQEGLKLDRRQISNKDLEKGYTHSTYTETERQEQDFTSEEYKRRAQAKMAYVNVQDALERQDRAQQDTIEVSGTQEKQRAAAVYDNAKEFASKEQVIENFARKDEDFQAQEENLLKLAGVSSIEELEERKAELETKKTDTEKIKQDTSSALQTAKNAKVTLVGTGAEHLSTDQTAEELYAAWQDLVAKNQALTEESKRFAQEVAEKQKALEAITLDLGKNKIEQASTSTSLDENTLRINELSDKTNRTDAENEELAQLNQEQIQLEKKLNALKQKEIQLLEEQTKAEAELNTAKTDQQAQQDAIDKTAQDERAAKQSFEDYRADKNIKTAQEAEEAFDEKIGNAKQNLVNIDQHAEKIAKQAPEEVSADDNSAAYTAVSYALTNEELQELIDTETEFAHVIELVTSSTELSAEQQQTYNKFLKQAKNAVSDNIEQLEDQKKVLLDNVKAAKKTDAAVKKNEKSWKSFTNSLDTKKIAKGVSSLVGGIGQLASGLQMLGGLKDIWSNDELSGWEKLLNTVVLLVPAITAIISAGKSLLVVLGPLGGMISGLVALSRASTDEARKNVIQRLIQKKLITEEQAQEKITFGLMLRNLFVKKQTNEEQKKANIFTAIGAAFSFIFGKAKKVEAAGENAATVAKKASTKATWAQVAANIGLQASMPPLLIIMLVIIAVLAILAAAIFGIVALINSSDQGLKKAKKNFEDASAAAESAAEEFNRVKEAFDNLKSSLEDYNDAQKAISELTAGTEEWRDAIFAANEQVLDLLSKYPELAEFISDSNGQLKISEEGQKKVLELEEQRVAIARTNQLSTQAKALEAANTVTAAEVAGTEWANITKNRTEATETALRLLSENNSLGYDKEAFKAALEEAGVKNRFIDNLTSDDMLKELIKASSGYRAKEIQAQLLNQQKVSTYLASTSKTYQNMQDEKEQSNVANIAARKVNTDSAGYEEERRKLYGRDNKLQKDDLKKVAEEYADLMGLDAVTTSVDKKTGEITYKLADGSEQVMNGQAAANAVIEQSLLDKHATEEQTKELVSVLNSIREATETSGKAIANAVSGNIENSTKKEVASLEDKLKVLNSAENQQKLADYNEKLAKANTKVDKRDRGWSKWWGTYQNAVEDRDEILKEGANLTGISLEDFGVTEDQLTTLGYKNKEEFFADMQKQAKEYEVALNSLGQTRVQAVQTAFHSEAMETFKEDKTLSYMTQIETGLAQAFEKGGQDGLNAFANVITSANWEEQDLAQINSILNSIDWSSSGAIEEFTQALDNVGITVDQSAGYWANFVTAMEASENTVQSVRNNLNSLRETLKTISEVTKDIKIGDVISDEDYNKLITKNKELSKYFVMTADGYAFIGGEDFKEQVLKAQKNTLDIDKIKADFNAAETEAQQIDRSKYFNSKNEFQSEDARMDFAKELATNDKYTSLLSASGVNKDALESALSDLGDSKLKEYTTLTAQQLVDKGYATSIEEAQSLQNGAETRLKNAEDIVETATQSVKSSLDMINSGDWQQKSIEAQTATITSMVDNYAQLKELNAQYKKENNTNKDIIEAEEYNKLARMYLAQEAAELGMYFSEAFLQDADNFDDIATAMEKARRLELDYFKDIETELNKLAQGAEKAFGQDKLTKLNQISDTLEKSVEQAKENAGWAEDILETSIAANDKEGFFNADGTFKDGMSRDNINNALAKAQADGDAETVSRLTELLRAYDAKTDADQAIIDKSWELVDAQIEAFEHGQNMVREFREFEKEWAQNINKLKNTNFDGLATFAEDFSREFKTSFENLSFSNDQWNSTWNDEVAYLTDLQAFASGGAVVNGKENPFWNTTTNSIDAAKAQEAINGQLDTMYGQYEDLYGLANELYDSIMSAGEEINALYDKQIEKLSSANDLLASSIELYKLVGKGMRGSADDIKAYSTLISANAMEAVNYAQAELLAQKRLYQEAIEKGDKAAIEAYAQSQADAAAKYAETLQNAFNTVAEQFGVQLEAAIDEAIGEGGLQAFSDAWELEKTYDNAYLDDVNAEYAMYEFDRNVQKSIDETDNIVAQNKLIEMRQRQEARLNAIIAERGRLSQHEIDLANAEYELTLKQIALEEAQQTANTMKLTRDAFGNYSYQYVADENKIADAEAEVKAAENELYNLRKEHEKELIDNFGAYLTDYQTQRAEAVAAGNDALVEALDEKYLGENGLLTNLQSEVLSLGDGTGLFVGQLDTIANMNFDNLKANIDSLTSSTKTQLEEITNTINSSIGSGDFLSAATTLANTATDLNTLTEDAEKIIGTFSSSVNTLNEVVGKLNTAASTLTTKANTAIGKYGDAVGENAIANNYDIEDIDISLADGNFIDSTGGSGSGETDEDGSAGGINISNFIGAINDKIADYFNSMSESLQNNDIARVLGSATEAIEENTEAIKTLTEELKEDSSTPPVVISGGGASQSPSLNQWANRNISQISK